MRTFKTVSLVILIGIATLGLAITKVKASPITYQVNRSIGNGTVTGFIETNGFIGTLTAGTITNWVLTLASSNLLGGPTAVIEFATAVQTGFFGVSAVVASETELTFDFDSTGSLLVFQGGGANTHFYCLAGLSISCGGGGSSETIGRASLAGAIAENSARSGIVTFATVAVIPLPAALPLYGTGLAVMGFLGWRRKRQALRD